MRAPRRIAAHPALACLACLLGLVLLSLPLGAEPGPRQPLALYAWLFGLWLLLLAFLWALGRALARPDQPPPPQAAPFPPGRTGQDV